jgi:hypothetical protein
MNNSVLNIISNILIYAGVSVIFGTHIWMLLQNHLDKNMIIAISSSNLIAATSIIFSFMYQSNNKDVLLPK